MLLSLILFPLNNKAEGTDFDSCSQVLSDITNAKNALENYFAINHTFPEKFGATSFNPSEGVIFIYERTGLNPPGGVYNLRALHESCNTEYMTNSSTPDIIKILKTSNPSAYVYVQPNKVAIGNTQQISPEHVKAQNESHRNGFLISLLILFIIIIIVAVTILIKTLLSKSFRENKAIGPENSQENATIKIINQVQAKVTLPDPQSEHTIPHAPKISAWLNMPAKNIQGWIIIVVAIVNIMVAMTASNFRCVWMVTLYCYAVLEIIF
jgi:hypothetical protein